MTEKIVMGYTIKKVPCSVCGQDIAKLPQSGNIGACNKCEKLYCPACFNGLKPKKCPLCNRKLDLKTRVNKWPKKWQPLLLQRSTPQNGTSHSHDFSSQLTQQLETNKFCRTCRRELQPDSRYCDLCGKALKN